MAYGRRYGYRKNYRSKYTKNSSFSRENWNTCLTFQHVPAGNWSGTQQMSIIAPLATLGTRRIRNLSLTIFADESWPTVIALVYLPQGMNNPNNLSHGVGGAVSTYEPNQHVLATGVLQDRKMTLYNKSGRTLAAGDSVWILGETYNPTNAPAQLNFICNLSYSISF